MAVRSLTEIRTYFETTDIPTEEQFNLLIDSFSVGIVSDQIDLQPFNQITTDHAVKKIASKPNSGNIFLTSTPQLTAGVNGQFLLLFGDNDNDTVTLVPGPGVDITSNICLKRHVCIFLVYVESEISWIEIARQGGSGGESSFDLSRLPETFDVQDTDYLVIHDGTEQKKVTKANLLKNLGGSFELKIEDEGSEIITSAKTLNFIGATVEAKTDLVDGDKVNIFIPPPDYASHFGTNDGTTDARVTNQTFYSRFPALPDAEGSPYKIGDWDGTSQKFCINNDTITYYTNEEFTIVNNLNTIRVRLIDPDNNIISEHETTLDGNKSVTQDDITITVSDYSIDSSRYKARVNFSILLSNNLNNGGRFKIEFRNDTLVDGIYYHIHDNLFYDTNLNTPILGSINFSDNVINSKQISGVYYYDLNSTFNVSLNNIHYLNDRSYPLIQLNIQAPDYYLSQLNLQGSELTGWDRKYNSINNSYSKSDWTLNTQNIFKQSTTAKTQARYIDWNFGSWIESSTRNILIDTFQNNSSPIFQDFRNEDNRYQNDLLTLWDSTADLAVTDSNKGLQLKNSQLIYPQEDFTIYNPYPTQQPDYTTLTGNRNYISYFYHTGTSHSNGRFRLNNHNITETIFSTNKDVLLEVSLNGTDWFSLNELYLGGALNPNDGCRINKDTYNLDLNDQIEFTLGTGKFTDNTTGPNGWGIWYRITYKDSTFGKQTYIGSIEMVNWI